MRLTTKGRFAVTAVLDLALAEHSEPVSLASIAQRQSISLSYLEQLFGKLRKSQIVKSIRGPGGGYLLAEDPQHISIAQIVGAVDEALDTRQCEGQENCKNGQKCLTHHLWANLNQHVMHYLSSVSLAHLVQEHQDRAKHQATLSPQTTTPAIPMHPIARKNNKKTPLTMTK